MRQIYKLLLLIPFMLFADNQNAASSQDNQPKQYIFSLSWHDGFCATHKNKKECKNSFFDSKTYGFVLHGLWPQPKNNQYCNINKKYIGMDKNRQWYLLPEVDLTQATRNELVSIMPATTSNLEKHEWIKHGSCSHMSSEMYFKKSIILTNEFARSPLASYIVQNRGGVVDLYNIKTIANRSFGYLAGDKIEMICDNYGNLTELRMNLGSIENGLKAGLINGTKAKISCKKAFVSKIYR